MQPLAAWRTEDGKIIFRNCDQRGRSEPIALPCGRCVSCLLKRAREWSVRCMHEASLHTSNCFLTLTYDDYHLPPGGSLRKCDFVNFMKRLRKRCGNGIRFFQCGEYGEKFRRPHHHVLLFGYDFPDKFIHMRSKSGSYLYRSITLEELWPFGFCSIGELTLESAAYTARYTLKKYAESHKADDYEGMQVEYVTMSRRPGIGKGYYEKYKSDLYNHDICQVSANFVTKPPKYYDNLLSVDDPALYAITKYNRSQYMKDRMNDPNQENPFDFQRQ